MKVSEGIRIEPIGLGSSIHNKALTFQECAYFNFHSTNGIFKGQIHHYLNFHPTNSILKGQIHHLTFVSNLRDLHSNSYLLDAIAFAIKITSV